MNKEETIQHALSFGFGGMSSLELSCLYDLCVGKNVLELGSMVGMSSYVIASVANDLACVDVWSDTQEHLQHDPVQAKVYQVYLPELPNMLESFKTNCEEFINSGKIVMYQGNTRNMAHCFLDESFDVIFVDADHSYEGVATDFSLYQSKVKPDGIIVFHDYGDCMWTGIARFCNEMVDGGKLQFINKTERVAVFKKYG